MQFLIYRPNSPSSPHHREKKMLTTLNNLTFDSHTPLSVQRNSYSLVFNPLSIPTKSYMRDRFSIESILFLRTLYRRPALQHSNHLYAPSAIRDAQCRKAVAPGDAQKRTGIKTQKSVKVKRIFRGPFCLFLGLPGGKSYAGVDQRLSGTASSEFFSALLAPLRRYEFHKRYAVSGPFYLGTT